MEEITYSNGETEQVYSSTGFFILDTENQAVTASQLVDSELLLNGFMEESMSKYNIVVSCTAHWNYYTDGINCDYATYVVYSSNATASYYVTQLECVFSFYEDPGLYNDIYNYINNPVSQKSYTIYNSNLLKVSKNAMFTAYHVGAFVHFNTGEVTSFYIDIRNAPT